MPAAVNSARAHAPETTVKQTPLQLMLPAALLFVSGGAALIYQVLWVKQLSLVVGVEVYAITAGISAFFAGLALGGLVFGRWADRLRRPVKLYAGLELAVAVLGVGATLHLGRAAGLLDGRHLAGAGACADAHRGADGRGGRLAVRRQYRRGNLRHPVGSVRLAAPAGGYRGCVRGRRAEPVGRTGRLAWAGKG
ncbi:hypothetical protein D3C81_1050800 [compost metagenome]